MLTTLEPVAAESLNSMPKHEVNTSRKHPFRPYQIVQSLINIALDARATQITVTLFKNGFGGIEVDDNGCGIRRQELPGCISGASNREPHSPPQKPWDHVRENRQQFLCNLAKQSSLSITSRVRGSDAWRLESNVSAAHHLIKPGLRKEGSTIYIEPDSQLAGSKQASVGIIADFVKHVAIANPNLQIELKTETGKVLASTRDSGSTLNDRWASLSGNPQFDIATTLQFEAQLCSEMWRVETSICPLGSGVMPQRKHSVVSINGEIVRLPQLTPVLQSVWKQLFSIEGRHFSCIFKMVSKNTPRHLTSTRSPDSPYTEVSMSDRFLSDLTRSLKQSVRTHCDSLREQPHPTASLMLNRNDGLSPSKDCQYGTAIGQYGSRYILSQSRSGLIIVDKVAVHEKMLMLQLTDKSKRHHLEIGSRKLVYPIELPRHEMARQWFDQAASELTDIGAAFKCLDQRTYLTHTPFIDGVPISLVGIFKSLERSGFSLSTSEVIMEIASLFARKSATKGEEVNLTIGQMNTFLRIMEASPESTTAIDGRPCIKKLKDREIQNFFQRNPSSG